MLGCYIPRASWVLKQGGMEAGCPDAGPFPFASCWALGLRPGSKVLSPRPKQCEDARDPREEQSLCTCVGARALPRARARMLVALRCRPVWSSHWAQVHRDAGASRVSRRCQSALLVTGICLCRERPGGEVTAASGRAGASFTRGYPPPPGCRAGSSLSSAGSSRSVSGRRRWRGGAPVWQVCLWPGRCVYARLTPHLPAISWLPRGGGVLSREPFFLMRAPIVFSC